MKVWVSRNMGSASVCWIWRIDKDKPKKDKYGEYYGAGPTGFLYLSEVKKALGRTPRKGSCKQMELTLKEIK